MFRHILELQSFTPSYSTILLSILVFILLIIFIYYLIYLDLQFYMEIGNRYSDEGEDDE